MRNLDNAKFDAKNNKQKHVIGRIVNTFGLKGELKVLPENQNEFKDIKSFYIAGFDEKFVVEKCTIKDGKFIKLKLKDYDDINQVLKFLNKAIFTEESTDKKLDVDEYLTKDLIGCNLMYKNQVVGIITDVENYGATDIFVYEINNEEKRVPFVDSFIDKIDIKNKVVFATDDFYDGVIWKWRLIF